MYRLWVRDKKKGGRRVIDVSPVDGGADPLGCRRLVFFVHGYNNNYFQASKTWQSTRAWLRDHDVPLERVVLFYWPGDYFKNYLLSALFYYKQVPTAKETAEKLAAYIAKHAGPARGLEVSFVAHSLGSLVVLHTLKLLKERKTPVNVRNVLLMAAAVPVGTCASGSSTPQGDYPEAFSRGTHEQVLYSQEDDVLRRFFRPGQALARATPPHLRRAVGFTGGPSTGPNGRWTSNEEMVKYDHGDYWESERSLQYIAEVLGRPIQLQGRPLRRNELRKRRLLETRVKRQRLRKALYGTVLLW